MNISKLIYKHILWYIMYCRTEINAITITIIGGQNGFVHIPHIENPYLYGFDQWHLVLSLPHL